MPSLYQLYEKVPNPRIAFHAIFFALFAFFIVSCYNKIDGIKKKKKQIKGRISVFHLASAATLQRAH